MHPFRSAAPPPHFPCFGEYVREIAADNPEWTIALQAPTFWHVNEYLSYILDLAIIAVGGKARIDTVKKPLKMIEQPVPNGPQRSMSPMGPPSTRSRSSGPASRRT